MKPILVLDLGGVLADLGSPTKAMSLAISDEEFWPLWIHSSAVRSYESGRSGYDEFIRELVDEFPPQAKQIGLRLRDWELELFPGIDELLRAAAGQFRLALLSNTNDLHWSQLAASHHVFADFEKVFLSFETGLVKPEPEAFLTVVRHFDCDASEINYFDDSITNIEAAAALGLSARRVVGPEELRASIEALSS